MKSAPSDCAARASRTSSRVLVVWAPIATGTRPSASPTTTEATRTRSSNVIVEKSPAAPPASRVARSPSRPWSTTNRT